MECDDDGSEQARAARGRGIKRHCGAGAPGIVRLAFTAAVPGAARARASPAPPAPRPPHQDPPFMSNMDEISYWIYTKRAPCLFNYDNILKKQSEQPQCSTAKPPSVKSEDREPSPKKKKLLDEDSVSTEKQQNVYFKTPQIQKPALNSCKSDRADSDIEFNINSSSGRKKSKNMKLQKTCLTREKSKKNKVCTSTPKVVQLRRSLRTAQQKWNNSNLNSSFEIFNASIVNGKQDVVEEEDKQSNKVATNNQSKSKSRSSGASRYPRRHRNNTETHEPNCSTNIALSKPIATGRRYNMRKGTLNVNRKENSEEKVVSKTRSGRRRGLKLDVEETNPSVLQLDSSMEQVTSSPGVNVACPNTKSTGKDNTSSRCLRSRTVNRDKVGQFYKESSSEGSNKKLSGGLPCALVQSTPKCVRKVKKSAGRTAQSLSRDSLRDKSGFAACFSDSDSDSAPLKQRKFFC
ncbi:uncharacterized protein LOC123869877 isoform X2 [Maniola jurtina]|uniref:uncharacterized protein LOC123869877 isoform X2 n=1 Tax=Maniola jurtina TaxID=191418 RepID=UPI001E68A6A4|nr:uncharacterized protein LOC123869877 isoform X2 [Maniola jurtina]